MMRGWMIVLVVCACGGKKPPEKPMAKPDECTAANKVAVEHGVELEKDQSSPLYTSLSEADIDCARRAVRSSAPLAEDAPQCLRDGRTLTTGMAGAAGDT